MSGISQIHIGGCILNRSPSDMHGADCDCFKIEFLACSFGKAYRVQMCREWVRYMAEREQWFATHGNERTSNVVKRYVREALNAGDDMFRWHYTKRPRSKVGKEVAGDYERLPTHFIEVVMDNRYGRLSQMIPCHIAAEIGTPNIGPINNWTGWVRGWRDVIDVNRVMYRRFTKALERACCRTEACKLTGLDDRRLLVSMNELLKIKIKEHETDEQQISAALPV